MMICLLALIVVLAVHSVTLDGAMEGVKFYLYQTSTISVRQSWKRDLWCAVTGILYFEYRYRCDGESSEAIWERNVPLQEKVLIS